MIITDMIPYVCTYVRLLISTVTSCGKNKTFIHETMTTPQSCVIVSKWRRKLKRTIMHGHRHSVVFWWSSFTDNLCCTWRQGGAHEGAQRKGRRSPFLNFGWYSRNPYNLWLCIQTFISFLNLKLSGSWKLEYNTRRPNQRQIWKELIHQNALFSFSRAWWELLIILFFI